MTTYRKLSGKAVRTVTTNPTDDAAEGQIWFNSTDSKFKSVVAGEAWTTSNNLGTARYSAAAFGSQTAGVVSMGTRDLGTSTNVTEHYDGTGWSSAANYPASGTGGGGAGTQTAGLIAGGQAPRANEAYEYDGTSWSETGDLPVAADNISFCGEGTQTNIIGAIGRTPSTGNSGTNTSVTYNGSTFSSGPNLNTARMYGNQAGSGTGTAGLIWGGFIDPSPNAMTNTEEYDGSSWSNGGNLNVASGFPNGWGTQTNTVTQVQSPNYAGSERYDGTSWTALPDIGVTTPGGLYGAAAGSTGDAGWVTSLSPTINKTVEFTRSTNVITAAAWASGGALPTALRGMGGFGTQTAAISAGGLPPGSGTTSAYSYDGSTWTGIPAIGAANSFMTGSRLSPGSAGSVYGGEPVSSTHQYWDGSSWSEQTDMNSPRYAGGGAGTQTSSLLMGGIDPATPYNKVEEWNGSSWTVQNTCPYSVYNSTGSGSQTAALIFGGSNPAVNTTAEYDGTNWTTSGNMITSRASMGAGGTQTSTLIFGGATSPPTTVTDVSESYDGSSWSTRPSLGTGRRALGSAGQTPTALAFGGNTGSDTTATEEFTPETTSLNIKDLTLSS